MTHRDACDRLLRLSANCDELDAAAIKAVLLERFEFIEALKVAFMYVNESTTFSRKLREMIDEAEAE